MSAVPQTVAPAAHPLRVFIRGRIEAQRVHDGFRYTRITTPAADEYSRPQTVEVRSKGRLGETGEVCSCTAMLGGYTRKPYRSTNRETGEITQVTPVDHTLNAIEG